MLLETIQYRDGKWSQPFPSCDSDKTAVFVFGSPEFRKDDKPISALRAAFPQAKIIGCSTSGEIFGSRVFDGSLSVAIVRFSRSQIKAATWAIGNAAESCATGERLAAQLAGPDLRGVFILSDGLQVNGSELVRGFNSILPKHTIVTGGLAGDGSDFKETWVIQDGKLSSGFVTAVGFYGNSIRIGHGSQGGWDIFGPERLVTKSEGNVLFELDGKPALQLYKDYLGEKAAGLPASALLFPLQIRSSQSDSKKLVRTVLSIDEAKQAMIFAGDIPQGHLVQLMRANFDRLIDGAQNAARAVSLENNPNVLALAISCVGRRLVLGERTEEEVEATLEALPPGTRQVGFYSYGEISPYVNGQGCELHNQTMTITTISEDE